MSQNEINCKVGDTLYKIYLFDEELERGGDEYTYEPKVEAVTVEKIVGGAQ